MYKNRTNVSKNDISMEVVMANSNITKKALAQSLKELGATKNLDKITVADITDHCGVNRQTFYYHFNDKYDLINWIFYTEFVSNIHLEEYKDALQLLEDICVYLYQERDFYLSLIHI